MDRLNSQGSGKQECSDHCSHQPFVAQKLYDVKMSSTVKHRVTTAAVPMERNTSFPKKILFYN